MESSFKRTFRSCVSFCRLLANIGILTRPTSVFWIVLWLVADVSEGCDVHIFGVEGGNKRLLRNMSPITSMYDVIPQKTTI
jgi:hypothetical protein